MKRILGHKTRKERKNTILYNHGIDMLDVWQ
jgi:hypothetical protein